MTSTILYTQRAAVGPLPVPPTNADWIALVSGLREARGIVGLASDLPIVEECRFATQLPQQAIHRKPHEISVFPGLEPACETNDTIAVDICHRPIKLYHSHLPQELRATDSAGD